MSFAKLNDQNEQHRVEHPRLPGEQVQRTRADILAGDMLALRDVRPQLAGNYLAKGWLGRAGFSAAYGDSNVGKTLFAIDLALHIAAQMPWHGVKVAGSGNQPSSGKVYYLALEGGSGFVNRICAVRQERPELFEKIEKTGAFVPWPTSIDLHGTHDGEAIASAIENSGSTAALIVIDTLARAMGDGDENTAKDMGQLIRNVDLIRERTGAHVMVIHHSGKDTSKGARGSGSLRAAVDTEIELTRSDSVVMAGARKQRDMPTGAVFAFTVRSVTIGEDEDGDPVTAAVIEPTEPVQKTPRLSGQQNIAMQAFRDAIAHHGERLNGDMFPANRQCVPLERWREYCDRHSLSSGEGDSSRRTAFHKVKNALQDKGVIRVVDGYVWRCEA